jgi:hypothetical protein
MHVDQQVRYYDIVALRKCLGFVSHTTAHGCPYCLYDSRPDKSEQQYACYPPFLLRKNEDERKAMIQYQGLVSGMSGTAEAKLAVELHRR